MDNVTFRINNEDYEYCVAPTYDYLYSIPYTNRAILNRLYDGHQDKIEYFLSNAYGYRPDMYKGWPECKQYDKDALYRAIVLTKCACYQPLYVDDYTYNTAYT